MSTPASAANRAGATTAATGTWTGTRMGDIREARSSSRSGHADGTFEPQPPTEAVLREGDVVMAIGTPRTLARPEALFESERPAAEWAG